MGDDGDTNRLKVLGFRLNVKSRFWYSFDVKRRAPQDLNPSAFPSSRFTHNRREGGNTIQSPDNGTARAKATTIKKYNVETTRQPKEVNLKGTRR